MENFIKKVNFYFSDAAADTLARAYEFAAKAHEGQRRESGEPYIRHPMMVAEILTDLGMDSDTVCAALLHDVLEDTSVTERDLEAEFGRDITDLVRGVTKLDKITFKSKEEEQAENFRKLFFAMAKDIRVLMIKLADRLHNMRTVGSLSEERQTAIARETLDIYAPLASRLGVSYLKCELEDLCLKTLHPVVYETIAGEVNMKLRERRDKVDGLLSELRGILRDMNIKGEVSGRPKHLYSIYKKMTAQKKSFAEIYDLTAVRVILNTVDECYEVLGRIHTVWRPLPGRIKDYIAMPKSNNYRSLHTTVMTSMGAPFEIQIRTADMHKVAEYGIAAHWKYKEKRAGADELDSKLTWLRQAVADSGDAAGAGELLETFKIDLYGGSIFTFTPKGDVIILPDGACPIDFAYKIHAEIGHKMTGARVNGKITPINAKLNTGDYVEIIFNPGGKGGPKRDWIDMCASGSAKSKIRSFFRRRDRAADADGAEPAKKAAAFKKTGGGAYSPQPNKPLTVLVVTAAAQKGVLARVSSSLSDIPGVSIKTAAAVDKNRQATITFGLDLRKGTDADDVIRRLKQTKGVKTVYQRK